LLRFLGASAQKNDERIPVLPEIDSVVRPEIYLVFKDTGPTDWIWRLSVISGKLQGSVRLVMKHNEILNGNVDVGKAMLRDYYQSWITAIRFLFLLWFGFSSVRVNLLDKSS
jgi:hypothetical protein